LDNNKFKTNPFLEVATCLAEIYLNENLEEECQAILEDTLG
jgi:hypothetical protein